MDTLLELFSFQGRVNRQRYLFHVILDDLVIFTMLMTLVILAGAVGPGWILLPAIGVAVAGIVAATAVTVKRLHDLNRPGWHWFGFMIPIYNIFLGFQLLFEKGTDGPNAYGPDPLQRHAASAALGRMEDWDRLESG